MPKNVSAAAKRCARSNWKVSAADLCPPRTDPESLASDLRPLAPISQLRKGAWLRRSFTLSSRLGTWRSFTSFLFPSYLRPGRVPSPFKVFFSYPSIKHQTSNIKHCRVCGLFLPSYFSSFCYFPRFMADRRFEIDANSLAFG